MLVVTVMFRIKPSHVVSFQTAVLNQAKNSLQKEQSCKQFEVLVSADDACTVFLYEVYTNQQGFDAHCKTEHFRAFSETVAVWIEEKQVSFWQPMEK